MEEGAAEVMRDVMRNAPNGAAMASAMAVFEKAGHGDLAQTLAQESRQQVVDLVAAGAAKAKEGDYKRRGGADARRRSTKLPDNPQVVFNAAVAVLKCLDTRRLGRRASASRRLKLIDSVRRLDPVNPKLPALAGLHQQILKKYNKGARARRTQRGSPSMTRRIAPILPPAAHGPSPASARRC